MKFSGGDDARGRTVVVEEIAGGRCRWGGGPVLKIG